jgi:hypothetical protein
MLFLPELLFFALAILAVNSMPSFRKYMLWFTKVTHFSCKMWYTTQLSTFFDVRFISSVYDNETLCQVSFVKIETYSSVQTTENSRVLNCAKRSVPRLVLL